MIQTIQIKNMKTIIKINTLMVIVIALMWTGCATTKVGKANYAGKYNYTITTPMGEQKGYIVLNREGKTYTGKVGSDQGSTDLSNLVIDGTKLTANFTFQSYDISVKGEIGDKVIEGTFTAEGYDIPFKAIKE